MEATKITWNLQLVTSGTTGSLKVEPRLLVREYGRAEPFQNVAIVTPMRPDVTQHGRIQQFRMLESP